MTRAAAAVVVVLLALVGCRDDGGGGASGSSDQVPTLEERSGIASNAVVGAVCGGWDEGGDSGSVRDYVHDLLLPLELVNSDSRPEYTQEDIDAAVAAACASSVDDPEAYVASVLDDLGLTETELDDRIAAACVRYRVQQERIAAGDWSGEDIGEFMRAFIDGAGTSLEDVRAAIDGICGPA